MKKIIKLFTNLIIFFSILYTAEASNYGFTYKYFEMADTQATLLGGKVHKFFPNGFGLGAGLYISETVDILDDSLILYDELSLNYIGVSILKPIALFSNLRIVPSIFYGQGNAYANTKFTGSNDLIDEDNTRFNIVEPKIALVANLSEAIKIETSFSYISIYGTELTNYDDNDFKGFTVGFSIVIDSNPAEDYTSNSNIIPDWGKMPGS